MESKTLATVLIVIACIFLFPVGIGILGGALGILMGVFGAIFGVIAGIFGAIFGGLFGLFGWIFDGVCWNLGDGFFDFNIFAAAALVTVIILISQKTKVRR
jgi:hypothetical protein